MNQEHNYPFPQVFLVDGGGGSQQYPNHQPGLVPCWSFPPPQERRRGSERSGGCLGVRPGAAMLVLMLFLLVFAALGFQMFQISRMQKELRELRGLQELQVKPESESHSAQKQIGLADERLWKQEDSRAAAHVEGRPADNSHSQTLRWNPHAGQGFTSGGVSYRYEDGALQVNETGLYHVYTRVELTSPKSSLEHTVFIRREGRHAPLKVMEANRAGLCSQRTGLSWTIESYLGSVLMLHKLDRVYVNVSQPNNLRRAPIASFFGLYKI